MRVLLDTNILVSGILIAGKPPARLLELWLERRFELVTSAVQIEELRGVLARPKITKRIGAGDAALLLENLEQEAICAQNLPVVEISPDPDDNLILATAIGGAAELIVSGDQAGMLDLREVSGIPIVTARQAIERLDPEAPRDALFEGEEGGQAGPLDTDRIKRQARETEE